MSDKVPHLIPETPEGDVGEVDHALFTYENTTIQIAKPKAPDRLLDLPAVYDAFEKDEYMPYWATLWPVAKFLAQEILSRSWRQNLRAIELGCGLGLPGLAASSKGIDVLFTDYDATALRFVNLSARLNGLGAAKTELLDWRVPLNQTFDLIIASDVIYERRNVIPLIDAIDTMLAPGGLALIADQNRPYRDNFTALLEERGYEYQISHADLKNLEDEAVIGTIYSIKKTAR